MGNRKPLLIILMSFFVIVSSNVFAEQKVVLNIAAYHKGYGWTDDCVRGIDQGLESKYKVIHYYMDTKRISKSEFGNATDKAWEEYLKIKPNLVMLGDDNALKFLGPKLAKENIPLVYYGINGNPRLYFGGIMPANVKGVLERVLLVSLVRNVWGIVKDHKNKQVTVLSDGSTSSAAQLETQFKGKRQIIAGEFKALFIDFPEWSDWKNFIKNAHKTNGALILINYHAIKDNGKSVDYKSVLNWTSNNSKLPVFIVQKDVGPGMATGALLLDGVRHGELAASIVEKVLQNKKVNPSSEDLDGRFIVSQSQLDRFHLKLPESMEGNMEIVE